jgi:hypothetical protein
MPSHGRTWANNKPRAEAQGFDLDGFNVMPQASGLGFLTNQP